MAGTTDIVLGVTRAVDSSKQREAVSRLEQLSGQAKTVAEATATAADAADDWEAVVRRAAADTSRSAPVLPPSNPPAAAASDKSADKEKVYVQFEALLLQTMVEAMMPEDSEAVFGSGTAGKVWKSMLAEKIAKEMAETGSIGIAKQIAAGPSVAARPVSLTPTKADNA